jgi:hypothetical protein
MSGDEIQWNALHGDWDPCTTCQQAIEEVFEPLEEKEIDFILSQEGVIEPLDEFEEEIE